MLIRHADADRDGAACAAIYAPYVSDSAVSFETVAPDGAEFTRRIARLERTHPFLVAVDDEAGSEEEVIGFAYAGPHHERAGYRWAATVSVYVDAGYQRRGVGRALYGALLELLRRQGIWVACSGITLPNEASVALHETCGFERVGVYRRIGWKAGGWRDVGWWQLALRTPSDDGGADDSAAPPEPGPPIRLDQSQARRTA
ncbi:MAG: N-acetyltransferase family protein [Solirubrobacteraceae bacterium]